MQVWSAAGRENEVAQKETFAYATGYSSRFIGLKTVRNLHGCHLGAPVGWRVQNEDGPKRRAR